QADRKLYRQAMQKMLLETANLTVLAAAVEDLLIEDGRVAGVITANSKTIRCGSVVLTTGTFLRGLIHIGEKKIPAGRASGGNAPIGEDSVDQPSLGLSDKLYGMR